MFKKENKWQRLSRRLFKPKAKTGFLSFLTTQGWGLVLIGLAFIMAAYLSLNNSLSDNIRLAMSYGSDKAPVLIEEYADFQCPACQQGSAFLRYLMTEDTEYQDKIKVVFYNLPLPIHANAELAAQAAMSAAEQNKFWPYHDLLYQNQAKWADLSKEQARQAFEQYAEQLGLNMKKFKQSLEQEKWQSLIKQDLASAISRKMNSTPTYIVNGQTIVGVRNVQQWQVLIDQLIAE